MHTHFDLHNLPTKTFIKQQNQKVLPHLLIFTMESSRTKAETIKPVLLKAGIPLAISVATFILAKITRRKASVLKTSPSETQVSFPGSGSHEVYTDEESVSSLGLTSLSHVEDEHVLTRTLYNHSVQNLQSQEIDRLRARMEELQERELELERKFLCYHDMKEQELVLMELHKNLLLEIAKFELLDRELASMVDENQRFEEMVVEYLKVLQELESSRLENGLLHRRVKRLSKKAKERSCVITKQNLQIQARETKISRDHEELEKREDSIRALEDEILELQTIMGRLQEEKNEVVSKLELAEKSVLLKDEAEGMMMQEYNQFVNELEQIQNDRAAEVKELIYLRWCNACLRHELMRSNLEQEAMLDEKKKNHLELDFAGSGESGEFGVEHELERPMSDHGGLGFITSGHSHSRRRKLKEKFKRWVEGGKLKQKLEEGEKHEPNCFGRDSVLSGSDERHFPARKSCSSA